MRGGEVVYPKLSPERWWRQVIERLAANPLPLETAAELTIGWLAQSSMAPDSITKYSNQIGQFLASCRYRGLPHLEAVTAADVADYLDEPFTGRRGVLRDPRPSTRKSRLTAVRKMYRVLDDLGVRLPDPTREMSESPSRTRSFRPLTDAEIEACHHAAASGLFDSRRPALVALAEASASATEIARVCAADIDLGLGCVTLGQATTRRTNPLTSWGLSALAQTVAEVPPKQRLVVGPTTIDRVAIASVSTDLRNVLNLAGLANDPRVTPQSIRAWSGRRVWEQTNDVIAVAVWLGTDRLDDAAAAIGLTWRPAA